FSSSSSLCYKDRVPKVEVFLDQVHHFVRRCTETSPTVPYFAFTFYIELTHNNFNKAQTIDWHVARFFNRTRPYLDNDTIVILMVVIRWFDAVDKSNLPLLPG